MYPCASCRAAAVGPDGRCGACGTHQAPPVAGPPPQGPPPQAYGYPPPMMAGPPMGHPGVPAAGVDLRRGLSTALVVLFSVVIASLVFLLFARGDQYGVIGDVLDGEFVSASRLDDADDFAAAALIINVLVSVPLAIVWAVWFRRLRLNAEMFAPGQHRMGPGWAAGAWFTPVVNLWFPKQIANDIWRASSPHGPQLVRRGLLNAWWVTFLVGAGIQGVGNIQYAVARDKIEDGDYALRDGRGLVEDLHTALGVEMAAIAVSIAAAVLGLLLVRQITRTQEQRATLPPQLPPPYAAGPTVGYGGAGIPAGYGAPPAPGAYPAGPGTAPPGYPAPGQPPHGIGPGN